MPMLQPIRLVPKTCTQRIVELKETLWTPLKKEILGFTSNQTTVLCPDQEPTDVETKSGGILTFLTDCTGYGNKIKMIRSITSHCVNRTQRDIIPQLHVPFDCCQTGRNKIT
ncbi:hypothetical protein L798_03889 [Zootermopsis nevadensis]|uniref:Uncharacterized protein n=1 Tax=Zootermopsis nevadensis TaxID=136037 RepID=A0A067QGD0_ZOONE|nr:hypothetical protein L798_03889 [Zootermopsis nevadensis]